VVRLFQRQGEGKRGALPFLGLDGQFTAVDFHQALADDEAKPKPLGVFRLVNQSLERLEKFPCSFCFDADATVDD
jgi:hypothetical protein